MRRYHYRRGKGWEGRAKRGDIIVVEEECGGEKRRGMYEGRGQERYKRNGKWEVRERVGKNRDRVGREGWQE